ncbi:hypothetical protein EV182_005682 [Spiromyces aspiralis]|uniref:Uncharacterized protein n=1 Tax=Spiromyces aspiralis TaxID=68401 RepID=A0ACC1HMF1_9FUNG|nr:hypothetical protein EV182_005682 [Spiromyces aspiralis]
MHGQRFSRLMQLAEILAVEDADDAPEVWRTRTAADPAGWALSEEEVKKLLYNRIDIPNERVQELKL